MSRLLGFSIFILIGQLGLSSEFDERIQGPFQDHAVQCINLLTITQLPGYVPPNPNEQIKLYREVQEGYSESALSINRIWTNRSEGNKNLFINTNTLQKIESIDRKKLESLRTLDFAAIKARLDYQSALLEFLSATNGDLAKIARVSNAYETRHFESGRGSMMTLRLLSQRYGDAITYSEMLLDQVEMLRTRYLNTKKNIEAYVDQNKELTTLINEEIIVSFITRG